MAHTSRRNRKSTQQQLGTLQYQLSWLFLLLILMPTRIRRLIVLAQSTLLRVMVFHLQPIAMKTHACTITLIWMEVT